VSSSAATSLAIAGTGVPDADAMMISARRTRIDFALAAPRVLLQPSAFLITEPPCPHRLRRLASRTGSA